MKKFLDFLKLVLTFPVIVIGVFYLFWFVTVPIDESFCVGLILLAIYFVISVFVKLSSENWIASLVLFVVLLPVAAKTGGLVFWLLTNWLDRRLIFSAITVLLSIYPAIMVSQKPNGKSKIWSLLLLIVTLPILGINVLYFVSYYPTVIDKAQFGGYKYYIASGIDMDFHSHLTFYKCKQWGFECTSLYRTYDRQDFDKIITDNTKNEVSAIGPSRLVFTDGENPRLFEGYPEQLGNRIFQISSDYAFENCESPSCDIYTYRLYECKPNYTSCNPLPIQYTENYDVVLVLDANQATNEINAYDNYDDTLIFTWGEHPRCYVEGCKVLGK